MIESIEKLPQPFVPTVSKIVRLGHIVVGASDHRDAIKFFTVHMNFKISDAVDEWVTFMRCFPNPLHHSFAIGAAPENRLHHGNFMVTDRDDIGSAANRLMRSNVPIVFGPGRHPQQRLFCLPAWRHRRFGLPPGWRASFPARQWRCRAKFAITTLSQRVT